MKSHRGTITSIALALALLAPSAAAANTLLSGYGGPGQGNQAILGAGLINPPSAGGGSGSANGSSASSAAAAAGAASAGSSAGSLSAAGSSAASHHAGAPSARHGAAAASHASASGARANTPASGLGAPEPALGSSLLGLSGADLAYILLAFGGLALTGALTWRVAGRTR